MWSKVTPRKAGVGLKRRRDLSKRSWGWKLAWWGSAENKEGGLTFARIERKTPVLTPALQSNKSSLCSLHRSRDRRLRGPNDLLFSIKSIADGRRQRSREIVDQTREKYRAKNRSLWNISTNLKATTFVILINHASTLIRKERLSPTSEARREASLNKVKKAGCQTESKA